MTITVKQLTKALAEKKVRSAWDRGVILYALELLEQAAENAKFDGAYVVNLHEDSLLNGARDWNQYSWGGSSLIFDYEIASRLCTPSELRKTRNGERRPNSREEWLDTQARALTQAARLLRNTARELLTEGGWIVREAA